MRVYHWQRTLHYYGPFDQIKEAQRLRQLKEISPPHWNEGKLRIIEATDISSINPISPAHFIEDIAKQLLSVMPLYATIEEQTAYSQAVANLQLIVNPVKQEPPHGTQR